MSLSQYYGVIVFAVLVVNVICAFAFGSIAEMKGHSNSTYALYVFFLGIFGMLMVIALPNNREKNMIITGASQESKDDELPEL